MAVAIPMGLWIGIGVGTSSQEPRLYLSPDQATFMSLNTVNSILFVVGVITVLAYFFFTVPVEGPMKSISEKQQGVLAGGVRRCVCKHRYD